MDGVDALLSTVQMPAGIPVATFAVGSAGAKNAAFFSAQVIALDRPDVAEALLRRRDADGRRIEQAESDIHAQLTGGSP